MPARLSPTVRSRVSAIPAFLPLLSVLLLVPAGCTDTPVAHGDEPLDAEEAFFLAEAGAASSSMAPRERSARGVEHATALLALATERAGPEASEEVRGLLRAAEVACELAERHHDAGRWRAAVNAAARCASLAREAGHQGNAERRENLAEQAEAAVAEARVLVEEAAALVSASSRPPGPQILAQAQRHLTLAEGALAAGRHPQALAQARQAAAKSLRIIHALGG
jgi:hypothetical protein